jgi:predicted nucleic acid-binding protein
MAENIIRIDTSILIDYFRKSDKTNSKLISLIQKGYKFHISAITEYEIYAGSSLVQQKFWEELLEKIEVVSFTKKVARAAVEINNELKRKRKQIALAHLFIAATAVSNNYALSKLNLKHFERIDNLEIIE